MFVFPDESEPSQFCRQLTHSALKHGFPKWVHAPELGGVNNNLRDPGAVFFNFFNQLTGSTAVKFPEQLQMQDLHSQPTEEVKFR